MAKIPYTQVKRRTIPNWLRPIADLILGKSTKIYFGKHGMPDQKVDQWVAKCANQSCEILRSSFRKDKPLYRYCRACQRIEHVFNLIKEKFPKEKTHLIRAKKKARGNGPSYFSFFATCEQDFCRREFRLTLSNKTPFRKNIYCQGCKKLQRRVHWSLLPTLRRRNNRVQIKCRRKNCENYLNFTSHRNPNHHTCRDCLNLRYKDETPYSRPYKAMRARAERYRLTITITINELRLLLRHGVCAYCEGNLSGRNNQPLSADEISGMIRLDKKSNAYFIDRIDSKKGYLKRNCVPCCTSCNYAKSWRLTAQQTMIFGLLKRSEFKKAAAIAKLSKHEALLRLRSRNRWATVSRKLSFLRAR